MKIDALQALIEYLLGSSRQEDASANAATVPCYEWAEYVPPPLETGETPDCAPGD